MRILVLVGFLVWLYVSFGWIGIVLLIGIIAFAILLQIQYELSTKNSEIKYSEELIRPHLEELILKRKQLCYDDGYGLTNTSKWDKEKKKFANNIVKISGRTNNLNDAEISSVIETLVNEQSPSKSHILLNKTNHLISEENISALKNGIDYESDCVNILLAHGWNAKMTKASGDQGADIIATKLGKRVVIQCKKYKRPVGNKAVQEIYAATYYYEADFGVVVSNGAYTISAKQLANKLGVHLLHHSQLGDLEKIVR